jgi:hypothetical protein
MRTYTKTIQIDILRCQADRIAKLNQTHHAKDALLGLLGAGELDAVGNVAERDGEVCLRAALDVPVVEALDALFDQTKVLVLPEAVRPLDDERARIRVPC